MMQHQIFKASSGHSGSKERPVCLRETLSLRKEKLSSAEDVGDPATCPTSPAWNSVGRKKCPHRNDGVIFGFCFDVW